MKVTTVLVIASKTFSVGMYSDILNQYGSNRDVVMNTFKFYFFFYSYHVSLVFIEDHRSVGLMDLKHILSQPINMQGREPYFRDFSKNRSVGLHSGIC